MKRGQKTGAEQVVLKLRQIAVQTAQGKSLALACKEAEISEHGLSERHACRIVGRHRGTQPYMPTVPADEDALTRAIIALASEYGRYGYRRVTALLQAAGWQMGKDRVQRIWRREGLKVSQKHRPRSRLCLNDGSCVRLPPLHRNHASNEICDLAL